MLCSTKLSLLFRKQAWLLSRPISWSTKYDLNDKPVSLIFSNYKPTNSAVGIDLGTTKTCVAISDGTVHKVLEDREGFTKTPSTVAMLHEDDYYTVGIEAERDILKYPHNTICDIKKLLFRKFGDPDVRQLHETDLFDLNMGTNYSASVKISGVGVFQPYEIAAPLLKKMKMTAERCLKDEVNYAVVTVPSYSSDYTELSKACRVVGFERIDKIKEPIAAALALDAHESGASDKVTAVYDFGGGKFEASIIKSKNGIMEAYSTGDLMLNGKLFDDHLIQLFKQKFREQTGIELRYELFTLELRKVAVDARVQLSKNTEVKIDIPKLASGYDLNMELTRKEFENLVDDLLKRTIPLCEESIKKATELAKITKKDIDEVVLVGGITNMPKVKDMVAEIFGREPSQTFNPEEIIALGAAVAAKRSLFYHQ